MDHDRTDDYLLTRAARRAARSLGPVGRRSSERARLREEVEGLRRDIAAARRAAERRGPGPERWNAPGTGRGTDVVLSSGLFDLAWYRSQVDLPDDVTERDALRHYLEQGSAAGHSPHPAFVADWYFPQVRVNPGYAPRRVRSAPLLHFLLRGGRQGLSPHPAFDTASYLAEHPEARDHPGGPLVHFLASTDGRTVRELPHPSLRGTGHHPLRHRTVEEFLRTATETATRVRDTRGHLHLERDHDAFDHDAEARLKTELRRRPVPPDAAPLVSVVLPTKDRAHVLRPAIDSVLQQTWKHLELLVVDDGSTDDTAALLAEYDDPRLVVLRHDEARGVAGARNTALRAARGDLVAYLDSDNTWLPDFLELVVTFMVQGSHRVAYAMSALVEQGGESRVVYRGMPFSREALEERNYIDCIVLVHERSLLETTGLFDEGLRRNVDWELFIRLACATDFAFLPVIATEYDVWDTRGDRISTEVPPSYRHVVRQRALVDWSAAAEGLSSREPDLLSVVVAGRRDAATLTATVHRALATARGPIEVVVVDAHMRAGESTALLVALEGEEHVEVHRASTELSLEVARNLGAVRSRGALLVHLAEDAWCEPGWDLPLREALAEHPVVQPVVLDQGGAVVSAGLHFQPDGAPVDLHRGLAGDDVLVRGTRAVDSVSHACVAVRAETFVAVEGFDPLFLNHLSGGDLGLRVAQRTGGRPACVGASAVSLRTPPLEDGRPPRQPFVQSRDCDLFLREAWASAGRPSGVGPRLTADGLEPRGLLRDGRPATPAFPVLTRERGRGPLRWALKIGPPDVLVRESWGDWHFARALQDSLEREGHQVSIDCHGEWYRPTAHLDDVVLVLRGLTFYEPNPDHLNLLWVISHPELVSTRELEGYNLVFGASARWCERVNRRREHAAEVLLQCTDQRRFHPVEPDAVRRHELLAVANARGGNPPVRRPAVDAALAAGLVPAVYGLRWEGLLPEGSWQGPYVPNEELPAVYAAAGAVLNDHWDDMRDEGLLSNRLFDLVACNARVISDHLPEVADVFGDVVTTFSAAEEIPDLLARHLEESEERRRQREELGERVRREHTFDARARLLSDRVRAALATARTPQTS